MNPPAIHTERKQRTVFISLPDESPLRTFYEKYLANAIEDHPLRLRPVSYLKLRQGRWMPQLEKAIAHCNAVIAFIKDNNPNVMLEVGRAIALGKPTILVAPRGANPPSMLSDHQIIYYSGNVPRIDTVKKIREALELAVPDARHRERSNERIKIQRRLLRTKGSRTKMEVDILAKANYLHHSGKFDKVVKVLSDWINQHGTNNEEVFHLLADTWFLRGENRFNVSEARRFYERQLKISEQGLALCPGSFALRKDRALALSKTGRFTEAEVQYNQLLLERDNATLHYDIACNNALMGNKIKALTSLERAIEMAPYYQVLARTDHDFDSVWEDVMFQALIYQHRVFP